LDKFFTRGADMTSQNEIERVAAAHRFHLRGTAVMIFIIYLLMTLTFQDFFLFNPTTGDSLTRDISLWFCLLGWISATFLSPLVIFATASGSQIALRILPAAALVWPISVIVAQITVYIQTGISYIDYPLSYPIFLVTDLALPIFLIVKWHNLRRYLSHHNSAPAFGSFQSS
jgi:hypothetical protein